MSCSDARWHRIQMNMTAIGRCLDSLQSGRSRAVSKLLLELRVPNEYKKSDLTDIIRAICQQVNTLSEGRISARYQAQSSFLHR
jgi:hypothetical protein